MGELTLSYGFSKKWDIVVRKNNSLLEALDPCKIIILMRQEQRQLEINQSV